MRFCLLVAVCLLVLSCGRVIATPIQWAVSAGGNGHWYEKVSTPGLNWDQAREAAAASNWRGLQGYLATITSAQENARVTSSMGGSTYLWLGGYQDRTAPDYSEPAGGWRWVTGETWSYTNWGSSTQYVPGQGQQVLPEPNNGLYGYNGSVGPIQHEEEDWLELMRYQTGSVAWNDTTYCDGTNGQSWSNGYLVEYGAVPEPSSTLMLLCGIGGLAGNMLRKRR